MSSFFECPTTFFLIRATMTVHWWSPASKSCRVIPNWGLEAKLSEEFPLLLPPAETPFFHDPWNLSSFQANCKILKCNTFSFLQSLVYLGHCNVIHFAFLLTLDLTHHPRSHESNYISPSFENVSQNRKLSCRTLHHCQIQGHVLLSHFWTMISIHGIDQPMLLAIQIYPKDCVHGSALLHLSVAQSWWLCKRVL